MPQLKPKDLLARAKAAWIIKDRWRAILQDAYELVFPGINPYVLDKKQPRVMNRQFDSTAPASVTRLANRILMDLTPPFDDWIDFAVGPVLELKFKSQPDTLKQLNEALSGASKIMNMIVNSGEMVASRAAAFLDLLMSGMGVILDLEDKRDDMNPISSQCVSQAEVAIEKNAKGRDCGIYRKRCIRIRDIMDLWDDAKLPKELQDKLNDDKKSGDEIDVYECSYEGGAKDKAAWYYDVIYERGKSGAQAIVERVYEENPWTIFHWMDLPGSPYCPGPVLLALADIRTANAIVEMILRNASVALAGMYLVRDDGVVNPSNITIMDGGFIPVGSTGGPLGASIVPLESGREFNIGQLVLEDYQTRIKKGLYDNGLPDPDAASRSATEIINRIRQDTQDIGGGIGRLATDLDNYVRRKTGIAVRRGIIPFDIKIDGFTIKMQINSPLARARYMAEVQTYVQWLQTVISLGGPQAAMVVAKLPEGFAWMGDKMGVPAELINDETTQQETQDNMAKIAAAGAAQQQPQGPMQAPAQQGAMQ